MLSQGLLIKYHIKRLERDCVITLILGCCPSRGNAAKRFHVIVTA